MPSQCVLVEKIPLNSGGKVDAKRLASGTVEGKRVNVNPVKMDGKVVDILLLPAAEGEAATMGAGIPEELEDDPYNILSEIFAAIPEIKDGGLARILRIPGLREIVLKLTDFDIHNMLGSIGKLAPKLMKLSVDQLPALPRKNADGKKFDTRDWLKHLLTMFEEMEVPEFPSPVMPFMPPVPFMPPMPFLQPWGWGEKNGSKERGNQWQELKKAVETQNEQLRDAQKLTMDACKEQWDKAFPKIMDMQKSFTASLPDEMPLLPGLPSLGLSPRKFMEKLNEFEEAFNEHAKEQAESFQNFYMQGQERARTTISKTMESIGDRLAKKREDAEAPEKE